jgi:hypothetical protein
LSTAIGRYTSTTTSTAPITCHSSTQVRFVFVFCCYCCCFCFCCSYVLCCWFFRPIVYSILSDIFAMYFWVSDDEIFSMKCCLHYKP